MKTKSIKVGSWYNKFDENQKAAFAKLMGGKYSEIQKVRSFLTASKKKFKKTDLVYNLNLSITFENKTYHWMNRSKRWVCLED